jgi:pyridinium-3,5-bisthiocarboxylic acid mononucleotide nickel chelatase
MRHIHLHPLGGVAGDMFVACLLDAFPEHRPAAIEAAQSLASVDCRLVPHNDGTLAGSRFLVDDPGHGHHHDHHHTSWRDIRAQLAAAALAPAVRAHATGIFAVLAEAEGRVHGVPADDVTFHEVGAVDSLADIVAAAALIEAVGPARWTVASLPVGGGTVRTAHGPMPVPAPATALLLEGFAMHDDGITGERVTPTGAAILRHLGCGAAAPVSGTLRRPSYGTLRHSGYGFGTRRLPGISNCLRALVFEAERAASPGHRELAVISFEVDDQSGEDLAIGLERLRTSAGVHDVVQMTAFGKKSRLAVHVQVLAAPDALDDVVDACFRETTTIGLRTHLVQGRALARRFATVDVEGHAMTVKLVERPGEASAAQVTGKAEADQLRPISSHAARTRLRQQAERLAMGQTKGVDPI